MLNSMDFVLPERIQQDVDAEIAEWNSSGKIARLWSKDASLWTDSDEGEWLDWLDIVEKELARSQTYLYVQEDIERGGFTDILLMGMGGSSLCPEVLAKTFGRSNFHILDSTVPAQVRSVEDKLDPVKTLFIVASKSGSTLEPNCFKQYFFDRLSQSVGRENAGRQFIAITDPGSKMEQVAKDDGFRHILYGEPKIGGRFSALSAFGLTAAAVMGLDIDSFLGSANVMVRACREKSMADNPGVLLGSILGICHRHGRDKLTILTSAEIGGLGAWLEQLIAESTGKSGVAIIPVDQEPLEFAEFYPDDRLFVFLGVEEDDRNLPLYHALVANGHPAIRIVLNGIETLGQEFFRWEVATAVAGSFMGINPFNQPDVESAKVEARKITDEYEQTGSLPEETAVFSEGPFSLFTSLEYWATLTGHGSSFSFREIMDRHIAQLRPGDYFAVLAYLEMTEDIAKAVTSIRRQVLERTGNATCLGFGPRFLHSTGQAYKGGANNGVFLQITATDPVDLPVPGQKYSFSVVKSAQERGDFEVLVDRGRRALRVHIDGDVTEGLSEISAAFQRSLA